MFDPASGELEFGAGAGVVGRPERRVCGVRSVEAGAVAEDPDPLRHPDGDLLLIDMRATQPRSEGIYLIRFGDGLVVKRLQLRPDGGANLISDNSERYPPLLLTKQELADLTFLGRVRWRGGRV